MTKENTPENETIVQNTEPKESKVKAKFAKVKSWCKEHKGEIVKDVLLVGAGVAAVMIAKIATDDNSEDEYLPFVADDSVEISDKTDEDGNAYYSITAKSSDDDDSEESNVDSTEE